MKLSKQVNGEYIVFIARGGYVTDEGLSLSPIELFSKEELNKHNLYTVSEIKPDLKEWQSYSDIVKELVDGEVVITHNVIDKPLEDYKTFKIKQLKSCCTDDILDDVPEFKQINAGLGLYSEEECLRLKNIIVDRKNIVDKCEEDIIASKDYEYISNVYFKKDNKYWGE